MAEILASLDDINAELPSIDDKPMIEADAENSDLIQLSVARVVRAYLSAVIDQTTLMGWDDPDSTPDTIREVAAKLIAAQVYFNYAARTNLTIEERNFAQLLYDQAMLMLEKIISGEILLEDAPVVATESMDLLDGFPIDDTDRAFTMGMNL
jgi:hypothetical protein